VLKREVGIKQYEINMLKTEFEKVKQEKDAIDFKIEKFVQFLHLILPNKLDLSYSGLDEFKESEFKGYGPENSKKESNVVCENKSDNSKENSDKSLVEDQVSQVKSSFVEGCGSNNSKSVSEVEAKEVRMNNDAPIIEDWVSDDEEQDESKPKSEKKTVIPTVKKKEFVKAKQDDKTVRNTVKYAEMYRSQKPRGNQRNWNNLKSQQLGNEFVMNNKACFACGSFNHLIKDCKRKVQKPIWNNARRVNHHNSHRMSYPHPKRNFVPKAVLMKTGMRPVNAAKPKAAYNVVKRNRFNVVKASACWVWMPKNRVVDHVSKNISASVTLKRLDYIDAQGRFKSVMAWMDAQAQGRQECSKEKEESREECSKSRKTKKMKCLEESSQQRK
ncbi:ribonuclease H-like domain-containing protein, partial [Tanacetum coccineum]